MDLVPHILLALVTVRLTWLLAFDDGPFNLFLRLRLLAGVRYDEAGNVTDAPNWIAAGLICSHCISFWVGLGIAWAFGYNPLYGLAYSTVTILIVRFM